MDFHALDSDTTLPPTMGISLDAATSVVAESAFACAGLCCLAVSVAVTVGEAQKKLRDAIEFYTEKNVVIVRLV